MQIVAFYPRAVQLKSAVQFGSQPLATLHQNLAEAMAWGNLKRNTPNPANDWRSVLPHTAVTIPHYGQVEASTVEPVIQARADALKQAGLSIPPVVMPPAGGRLLVYPPSFTLADGAAEEATQGFFDVFNIPAYDSWVTFANGDPNNKQNDPSLLVSWIPDALIPLVQKGLDVNMGDIDWLDNLSTPTANAIKTALGMPVKP